ncbi:hypothetical protein OHA25_61095 (plasmid) [Nonomuraea sp. NBC_00507]|uniref:hypothetical protein n=1 Tax=Nonomuraea sp. NBC_00507 TaxID=2976002 RepID=UPI002E196A0D
MTLFLPHWALFLTVNFFATSLTGFYGHRAPALLTLPMVGSAFVLAVTADTGQPHPPRTVLLVLIAAMYGWARGGLLVERRAQYREPLPRNRA